MSTPNRSVFPNDVDSFQEVQEISASDIANINRYQELKLKQGRSVAEDNEFANLSIILNDKLFTADKLNKLQDCITNLEEFFLEQTKWYVMGKQEEFQAFTETKQSELDTYAQNKKTEVTNFVNNKTTEMTNNVNNFTDFVELKKSEIQDNLDATTAGQLSSNIGIMANLKTTDKTSLVNAINEVHGRTYYKSTVPPTNTDYIWLDIS